MTESTFTNWRNHCYVSPCEFSSTDESFTIQTDAPNSRGSWYCYADLTPVAGEQYVFQGEVDGPGFFIILFFSGTEVDSSIAVENGTIITIPTDIDRLRLDLRLWNAQGTAVFSNISLNPYVPPPPPPPGLEVPLPDMAQKHHVTGWKWGSNIALFVHPFQELELDTDASQGVGKLPAADTPPTYVDENEDIIPYEVKGWQHGRHLDLEIGNMRFTDEEE